MAVEKYTVEILDSDGNSSKLVLPGFAMEATQEKMLKSIQALGKMDPKTAKAYEDLIKSITKGAEEASDSTEKQTEELEKVLTVTSDKQVKALKTFRENFADRVGKDMRDTFVSGGNILTAAIKTATVGLAAGAGLLYKTFMDTSEAFRSLSQAGLGTAGPTGREAQDAVRNLTLLGMSASEAASLLTSFSRASATLGKANFAKFVSGIALSGTFAADLGLTLEEAAEYASEELEMRQKSSYGRLQLDAMQLSSIKESIKQTQRFAGVMGVSMKDINASKREFVDNNANLANLLARTDPGKRANLLSSITDSIGAAAGAGENFKSVFSSLVNSAALLIPTQDANLQSMLAIGGPMVKILPLVNEMNRQMTQEGRLRQSSVLQLKNIIQNLTPEELNLLAVQVANNDAARALQITSQDLAIGGDRLTRAVLGLDSAVQDPMITAGANFLSTIDQISGAVKTAGIDLLGGLAKPLNEFTKAFLGEITDAEQKEIEDLMKAFDEKTDLRKLQTQEEKDQHNARRQAYMNELYEARRSTSTMKVLRESLNTIGKTFMTVFFGDIEASAKGFGEVLNNQFIPWLKTTTDEIKAFLESLDPDGTKTFGEKVQALISTLAKDAAKAVLSVIGSALYEILTSPTAIGILLGGFTALFALSVVKTAVASAIATGLTPAIASIGTALTGLVTSIGIASRNIIAASMTGLGKIPGFARAAPFLATAGRAIPAVGGAAMIGKDIYDVASGTDEANAGANWGGIIGGVLGAAAGGVLAVGTLGLGTPAAIAMAGGGAMPGNTIGDWIGGWFDSPEGEEAKAEMSEQLMEDQGALVAMALDPAHILAVRDALVKFNEISLAYITEGINELAGGITNLVNAFTSLQQALSSFVSQTTSTIFDKMADIFLLRTDRTDNIIAGINKFAKDILVTELTDAASAIASINKAIQDFATPLGKENTRVNQGATAAEEAAARSQSSAPPDPSKDPFLRLETQLVLIRHDTKIMTEHLDKIQKNTKE